MVIEQFSRRLTELLPQLVRGFARHDHNHLTQGRITLPQLWAMEYLSRQGHAPMNEIARFLAISRPATTGLIERLIGQGLARRESDRRDRRIVRVTITAKGRRIVNNIWEQKRRTLTKVFRQISPGDRAQYLATLKQVVNILGQAPKETP